MKFGKTYLETLNGPRIPAEWRQTAIEYRKVDPSQTSSSRPSADRCRSPSPSQLKKVINRVASELAELGLTSDVLKDLLESRPSTPEPPRGDERAGGAQPTAGPSRLGRDDDLKDDANVHVAVASVEEAALAPLGRKIEWDSSDEEAKDATLSAKAKGKRRVSRRRATASYELGGAFILVYGWRRCRELIVASAVQERRFNLSRASASSSSLRRPATPTRRLPTRDTRSSRTTRQTPTRPPPTRGSPKCTRPRRTRSRTRATTTTTRAPK